MKSQNSEIKSLQKFRMQMIKIKLIIFLILKRLKNVSSKIQVNHKIKVGDSIAEIHNQNLKTEIKTKPIIENIISNNNQYQSIKSASPKQDIFHRDSWMPDERI